MSKSTKVDFNFIDIAKKLWGVWNNEDQSVALSATFMTVAFGMWLFTNKLQIIYVVGLGFVFLGITITKHIVDYNNRVLFLKEQKILASNAKEKAEINKQMEIISSKHDLAEEAREIIIEEIIGYLDGLGSDSSQITVDNNILKLYAKTLKRMKAHSFELAKDAELPYKKFIDAYFKSESHELSIDDIPQILDLNLSEKEAMKLKKMIKDEDLSGAEAEIERKTHSIKSFNRSTEEINRHTSELLANTYDKPTD